MSILFVWMYPPLKSQSANRFRWPVPSLGKHTLSFLRVISFPCIKKREGWYSVLSHLFKCLLDHSVELFGVSPETPKSIGGWVQIYNCSNPWKANKTKKARQADARLHPPVSLCPCIKVFSGQICKKVHRLLYHSLCTDVAKDCYFNKNPRIVESHCLFVTSTAFTN